MATAAELQFNTSSKYTDKVPSGYTAWQIRNDYPPGKPRGVAPGGPPAGTRDAPWVNIDPFKNTMRYMEVLKEYCFEGMTSVDFVPQKNTVRQWYHAPWMHYDDGGREPLHGLTAERFTPPRELSATQERTTQTWAVGFFNTVGASVFGGMWADPNNPDWTENIYFPEDTLIYKLLFTNATDDELPILTGSPTWEGLIAVQPQDPKDVPSPAIRDLKNPQSIRLLQLDIGVKDRRAQITGTGWMWCSFMYCKTSGKTGWDGLIPIGLQWGDDPELTQARYEAGNRVKESWINPEADAVRISLHGGRPSFGWNGRLNGPTDNFISSCCSCHSTAEWPPIFGMVPPAPIKNDQGEYVPVNDSETMKWFQNIWCGEPITRGCLSADNSMQLLIGYQNFTEWLATQPSAPGKGEKHAPLPPADRLPAIPRQGPIIKF